MSKNNTNYTESQQNVINFRGKNMLVSASAGTGKTTVMIERIVSLIEEGADVNEIVVVTFTNLAAAEMKARLAAKLSEKRGNPRVLEQLEKLDSASICTLHSFCSDLLRNYFYVVDIDPAFAILDDATVATLRRNTLDELFAQCFAAQDDAFRQVYKIFSTHRQEDNFKKTLLRLYDFSRCLENFGEFYTEKRQNFLNYSDDNPVVKTLMQDVSQTVAYCQKNMAQLAERSRDENLSYTELFQHNVELLGKIRLNSLEHALNDLCTLQLEPLPRKGRGVEFDEIETQIRTNFADLKKEFESFADKYARLARGQNMETLWGETQRAVTFTDKLAELVLKFDEMFFEAKKQRGGVDFNDLEHLTLKVLRNEATLAEIRSRYKLVFVDEYQDTNPVQEAIVKALATKNNLFMVGDVKQSIYGFRGCEPSIFIGKYDDYKATGEGSVVELNDNFRSNGEILDFVNDVFNVVMTSSFGKVDYRATSQLHGINPPTLKTPSTRVDFLLAGERERREVDGVYDITTDADEGDEASQGELIAKRIKEYVGMAYRDKNGHACRIGYGDIVILMRGLTSKATDIYNTLIAHNIPVAASFKVDGLSTKEVRDLVNLFRVIDNPYVDVSFVGASLSPFGGFTEAELGHVRLDTEGRVPFYERMQMYAYTGLNSVTVHKIRSFLDLLQSLRFYARSASVSEVALKVLQQTNYHLYVEGLPNGALRLRKLYAFIDGLKGAPYAQSIDKFLSYIDETDSNRADVGLSQSNAVRLMTMHASKGLEFPVVFVAGVETQFRFDSFAVEQNADLGLATRYYNFDNMRVVDTLGSAACGLFNRAKQREEEMRLLYVAMTRAKFALNVVGTVTQRQLQGLKKSPTRASSHLDWLLLAVDEQLRSGQTSKGLELNVIDGLVELGQERVEEGLLCQQLTDVAAIEQQLSYVYPHQSETQMPSKIVSSALDKEYVDVTDEPHAEFTLNANADRNFVGTAYHKVYQYAPYTATVEQIKDTLAELVASGKVEQRFAEQIDVQLVHDTLHNPQLVKLLQGGKVYHEIPFMLSVPYDQVAKDKRFHDEVMLQGVIDLLVLRENSAVVIDFKYTQRSDLVEERYQMQLNSYKLAVERICGISDVETYVLSIADNKLIKM